MPERTIKDLVFGGFAAMYSSVSKGGVALPNLTNFQKSAKGGRGFIFNPKNYVADFGSFEQGFLSIELIQTSNFRVQNLFFLQLFWEKSKQDTL